ncbi:hypothetical protein BBBOND_0202860 [Babesia bigemina]|uniref:Uncharacterized protein n=1 Tax=Babesia bigemina TaxID=5866 RepID=A0A061D884_BABBI|nr:hypothetical protein BBBOND_0202860 [Babesia bigemina]CDR95129.1 hypothetical protein BBBOND_0202860 [Babesia bigemina]|eukprot:XP_012767315.1 hypothetical protein BBBOND_0202860 [Babesia bigemina]
MYTSVRSTRGVRNRESSLLSRLVCALRGSRVLVTLSNGTTIAGVVAYYQGDIRTVNVHDSVLDLQSFEGPGRDLQLPPEIRDACLNSKRAGSQLPARHKIVTSPPSHFGLTGATVCLAGRRYSVSKVEVDERWVSTVLPSDGGATDTKPGSRSINTAPQLRRLVLQQPADEIKNAAFLRCSRIGEHNLK